MNVVSYAISAYLKAFSIYLNSCSFLVLVEQDLGHRMQRKQVKIGSFTRYRAIICSASRATQLIPCCQRQRAVESIDSPPIVWLRIGWDTNTVQSFVEVSCIKAMRDQPLLQWFSRSSGKSPSRNMISILKTGY